MKKILALPAELYQNRKLVLSLAKNDFKTKYAGSYLGIVWAFIQPIVKILVCIFRRTEGRNGIGLPFCTLSGIRYRAVVFLPGCIKRWNQCPDRIQLSCEEGCIQDQHPSHRKDHLRTFRACFLCGLCTDLMCMLRIYTKPLYTADHLLLCLHLPFCTGTCVCYKCDRHFFP